MLWCFRPTVMLEHNSPRANCLSSLHDLDQISRDGQRSWGTIFLLKISVWGTKILKDQISGDSTSALHLRQCSFSRVEMSHSSLGHVYQQASSQCWQWERSFVFVTTAKELPQIQHHGSQVFLLERIPCLKSWSTCPVMQGSMEIKLTMVFIPPVLPRWSKPMHQRRVTKKALGTVHHLNALTSRPSKGRREP